MYDSVTLKQVEEYLEDFEQHEREVVLRIKPLLLSLNENCHDYVCSYSETSKSAIDINQLSIEAAKIIVSDMKARNRSTTQSESQESIRDSQMSLNKYGPNNPYGK